MPNSRPTAVFAAFLLSLVLSYPIVSDASNTIVVTSNADTIDAADGLVTLREAMTVAHKGGTMENGEEIDKTAKVYIDLSQIEGEILLTSRLPRIDKNLAIYGDASLNLTINGQDLYRIIFVYKGALTLENLILKNGRAKGGKGANGSASPGGGGAGMGGAIFVNKYSSAKCRNVQFIGNKAQGGQAGDSDVSDTFWNAGGGGFYGDASSNRGGSGGYLGNEGKGGDLITYSGSSSGGFGGGGGAESSSRSLDRYGGDGGFGGGAACGTETWYGTYYDGDPGAFGGTASHSSYSDHSGGGAGLGGAVFVREHGIFKAKECTFQNNSAQGGKGSKYRSYTGNRGQGKGGAIFNHNTNAKALLEDCSFNGNSSQDASGNFIAGFERQDNNDLYGANSPIVTHVNSMRLEQYPPVSETEISYLVQFDADVTGVDVTDFDFDADDVIDTHVASVEAIDARNYRVVVTHLRQSGFVTLKLVDDDTIVDAVRNYPLGFTGEGNGNFTGETCNFHPTVQVRSILPLTGGLMEYGDKILKGIELAVAEHKVTNTAVPQAFWTFSSLDNQSATSTADASVEDASNNESVLALFGGAASNNTLRMAELCQTNQIPMFSPTSTSTLLSDKDYTVKVVPLDNYQVEAIYQTLYKYVFKYQEASVAILAEDSEYGRGFFELENKEDVDFTGKYVFPSHSLDVEDAIRFLEEMRSTKFINAVVLAMYEDDANALLQELERNAYDLLVDLTYIFTDSAATGNAINYKYLPSYLVFFGVRPIIPETPTAKSFANKYQSAYGSQPEWFSYYACDAVTAFDVAIKNSTEITREGVWNAVPWMHFDGVTGSKTFDEKGNLYSAAYDLLFIDSSSDEWHKIETIHVFQPEYPPVQGVQKVMSRNHHPTNVSSDFTYTLNAADPLINHLAGEQTPDEGWMAESLDASLGGLLMAYYEDVERGLSNEGEEFVFEDGATYYLTFNLFRMDQTDDAPDGADALEVTVKSVYRYQNGDGVTHFARTELVNQTVNASDWPSGTGKQITIPIVYASTAPSGVETNNEDNRFHWELKLLNAAQQKMLLTSVEIGTSVPTGIGDYMLY